MTAVDRNDAGAEILAVLVDGLGYLHRKLAGGHENERGRLLTPFAGLEPVQDGKRERSGLPCSSGGLPEEIASSDQVGDGLGLDRCWLFVPERRERSEQLISKSEVGECLGLFGIICAHVKLLMGNKARSYAFMLRPR